jgi:DNA-binding LacI/PurR family transcriptional regulator
MAVIPEYMRIRTYILNLIRDEALNLTQIPAESEICRRFEVSRSTVRQAIKGLVEDGYLIPKRGFGTVINRDKFNGAGLNLPVIGVIRGDGRCVTSPISSELVDAIRVNGLDWTPIYLPNSNDPQRLVEYIRHGVKALVWEQPTKGFAPYLDAIRDTGIPLLQLSQHPSEICDSLAYGSDPGAKLADLLHSHGHSEMIFVNTPMNKEALLAEDDNWLLAYCARMEELTGKTIDPAALLVEKHEFEETLFELKRGRKRFSAIYALGRQVPFLARVLNANGLRVPDDLSLVTYRSSEARYLNCQAVTCFDFAQAMRREFYEWLQQKVYGESAERFTVIFDTPVVDGESVATKKEEHAVCV